MCESCDDRESWLLRRAGFGPHNRLIQLVSFNRSQTHYDPYEWGDRTYQTAHEYIMNNWDDLESGQVICVEHILGERELPKKTEQSGMELPL